tara:strand:+ start:373 stop:906 length:534 start_codon:yes stop_codon:yes gene_type:complete
MTFKFKNKGIFISILMIRLDNIETPKARKNTHIYRDLHLDLEFDTSTTGQSPLDPATLAATNYKDIKQAVNEGAIKNSLTNLFNTFPGQKLLNPEYGLDLTQYLFTPVSDSIGRQIGEEILSGIQKYEPRVEVQNVSVGIDEENSEYEIGLSIKIPRISNTPINVSGILNQTSFKFE